MTLALLDVKWGGRRDSNPQHPEPQSGALPLSYDHRLGPVNVANRLRLPTEFLLGRDANPFLDLPRIACFHRVGAGPDPMQPLWELRAIHLSHACPKGGEETKTHMNRNNLQKFSGAMLLAMVIASPMALAQTTVVSSTTTAGTITEFSPDAVVLRTETATEPVRYTFSKETTYVDETGAPVSIEMIKSGLPVTVHYVKEADRMIARKVVVKKRTSTTTSPAVVEKRTSTTAPAAVVEKRTTTTAPAPIVEEKKTTTTTTTTK